MFCSACGATITAAQRRCHACGKDLTQAGAVAFTALDSSAQPAQQDTPLPATAIFPGTGLLSTTTILTGERANHPPNDEPSNCHRPLLDRLIDECAELAPQAKTLGTFPTTQAPVPEVSSPSEPADSFVEVTPQLTEAGTPTTEAFPQAETDSPSLGLVVAPWLAEPDTPITELMAAPWLAETYTPTTEASPETAAEAPDTQPPAPVHAEVPGDQVSSLAPAGPSPVDPSTTDRSAHPRQATAEDDQSWELVDLLIAECSELAPEATNLGTSPEADVSLQAPTDRPLPPAEQPTDERVEQGSPTPTPSSPAGNGTSARQHFLLDRLIHECIAAVLPARPGKPSDPDVAASVQGIDQETPSAADDQGPTEAATEPKPTTTTAETTDPGTEVPGKDTGEAVAETTIDPVSTAPTDQNRSRFPLLTAPRDYRGPGWWGPKREALAQIAEDARQQVLRDQRVFPEVNEPYVLRAAHPLRLLDDLSAEQAEENAPSDHHDRLVIAVLIILTVVLIWLIVAIFTGT